MQFSMKDTTEETYETTEIGSSQIFHVKEEMLTYRGKRYSLNDIAASCKKDCRMWLWKNNMQGKNRSLAELRQTYTSIRLN